VHWDGDGDDDAVGSHSSLLRGWGCMYSVNGGVVAAVSDDGCDAIGAHHDSK
jgi:hypothetical protein